MYVYTVYKYQIDWELTPFSFLRGAAFAWGSLNKCISRLNATLQGYLSINTKNPPTVDFGNLIA